MMYYIKENQIENIIEVLENMKGLIDSFIEQITKLKTQQVLKV